MYVKSLRSDELYHFGVKGMKWGVRRYQNPDGTLTAKGKKHKQGAADYYSGQANSYKQSADKAKADYQSMKKSGKESMTILEVTTGNIRKDSIYSVGERYINNSYVHAMNKTVGDAIKSNEFKVGQDYILKGKLPKWTKEGSRKLNKKLDEFDSSWTKEENKLRSKL